MSTPELLPCPFCGTVERDDDQSRDLEDWLQLNDKPGYFVVECFGCGCEIGYHDTAAEAIANWNRRHHPGDVAGRSGVIA